jgi:phage baseplate assembly protein W
MPIVIDPLEAPPAPAAAPAPQAPGIRVPKLRVPLQMGASNLATVEQDSSEEITASVYALLATERGSRLGDPDYGVEEAGFDQFPPDEAIDEWLVQIGRYEPRARVRTVAELEGLLARINVRVGVRS